MKSTKLYWIDGPWAGKLALAARPRGGDWLEDELEGWSQAGIGTVFSLLTPEEEQGLDIESEASTARAHGMKFWSFPIEDRQVPDSASGLAQVLQDLDHELEVGGNVVVHCRQGIGRTGLVSACLLVMSGVQVETAIQQLSVARGLEIPETPEQRRWIEQFARTFSAAQPHG